MPRTQIATRGLTTMGLASAMVLISLGGITPAGASPPQGQSKSVNVHFVSLQQEESYAAHHPSTTATPSTVCCGIRADNPHYSKGARSVIYKSYLQCNTYVYGIKERGVLEAWGAGDYGPPYPAASETYYVSYTGSPVARYVPARGSNVHITYSGDFSGCTTGTYAGKSRTYCSNIVFVPVP
jgi:hypothetical protein